MRFFFEYIWFRICRVYRKEDKFRITGSGFLALAQSIYLDLVIHYISGTFDIRFLLELSGKEYATCMTIVLIALITLNHRKYMSKYDSFETQYSFELKAHSIAKGILVIIFLLVPFAVIYFRFKI